MAGYDKEQAQSMARELDSEDAGGAVYYQEADEYTAGLATTQELVSDMYKMGTIEDKEQTM
ncbi:MULTISPECIES: DUF4025 domain-containing protein [Brevibacillus]|uniref:DUF4025 domain-containing protein n=1 Tax=Brevibacillus TaxID=55080 RepID=UPI000D0FA863|nr:MULTISPECIES: DUF4025 domain-containing protein [Brevibacillus]PSJ70165.1 DUF4025 domain-containing protein [Brevibacillus brevis]RED30040.1 uncharacterized protein DUF4025 [Brevibacillus brevis]TQK74854.1 uncharacterized protein DUF4025 [Brevibacillus sp. AG162]VEF88587.1 Uncharacterised protein [Brevibacillus brevis]GEC88225.1 hypothetical protein BBR01nite_05560 [Brevibacillus brevis]